ncbi:MAG: ATP-grasp domain-containing protein [Micrococcaceae bacterium]
MKKVVMLEASVFGLPHIMEAAKKFDVKLVLLAADRARYVSFLDEAMEQGLEVIDVDTMDVDASAAAIEKIDNVAGIMGNTGSWAPVGARVAKKLGFPGQDPEIVDFLRNKKKTRECLVEAGISKTRSFDPSQKDVLKQMKDANITFPIILKPTSGSGSRDVFTIHTEEEFNEKLKEINPKNFLIETFIKGPLYSAELFVQNDKANLLGISGRILTELPVVQEEAAFFPARYSEEYYKEIEEWMQSIINATGFGSGFMHAEYMQTIEGPEIVEINPRLGGGLIGECIIGSTGINIYEAMISIALDEKSDLLTKTIEYPKGTAQVLKYVHKTGKITHVTPLPQGFPGNPQYFPARDEIDSLEGQSANYSVVYAEGDNAPDALDNVLAVARLIVAEVE